jgi:hypothetical protein
MLMKIMQKSSIAMLGLILVFGFSINKTEAVSYIDLGQINQANVNLNLENLYDTNTSSTSVESDTKLDVGAEINTSDGKTESAEEPEAVFEQGGVLEINRSEINSEIDSSVSIQPEKVSTETDLKAYASSLIKEDDNASRLVFAQDRVELTYSQKGRLFSLFPVHFDVVAITHADGRVELKSPWYTFLVRDNRKELEAEIKSQVSSVFNSRVEEATEAQISTEHLSFSAAQAAQIAQGMQTVLSTNISETGN